MAPDDQDRLRLLRRLEEVLGPEEAAILMTNLPPERWTELATRRDLDAIHARFDIVDLRFDTVDQRFDRRRPTLRCCRPTLRRRRPTLRRRRCTIPSRRRPLRRRFDAIDHDSTLSTTTSRPSAPASTLSTTTSRPSAPASTHPFQAVGARFDAVDHDFQAVGARFDALGHRVDGLRSELVATVEGAFRRQLWALLALMIAWPPSCSPPPSWSADKGWSGASNTCREPGRALARPSEQGDHQVMRYERTITSISWIPSDALAGMAKLGTKMGVAHDDLPPPDHIGTDDAAPRRAASVGPVPLRQPAPRPGSRSRMARSSTTASPAPASWGRPRWTSA